MKSDDTMHQAIDANTAGHAPASFAQPNTEPASAASGHALQHELTVESRRDLSLLGWATALLIAAAIAAFFAFSGMVGVATGLATLVFYVCVGLLVATLVVLSLRARRGL